MSRMVSEYKLMWCHYSERRSLLAGLYLPVELTTGHSKNRCVTSIWATLWMSRSGTSLTAIVEILECKELASPSSRGQDFFLMDLDSWQSLSPTLPILNILSLRKQRNVDIQSMYSIPDRSCVNREVKNTNKALKEIIKGYPNISLVESSKTALSGDVRATRAGPPSPYGAGRTECVNSCFRCIQGSSSVPDSILAPLNRTQEESEGCVIILDDRTLNMSEPETLSASAIKPLARRHDSPSRAKYSKPYQNSQALLDEYPTLPHTLANSVH
ncbi:hypothetical protein J6590_056006 [Homalodisca vitripennis]|nr:hypothetical protein J6590_056006 [Homalodisca vitripennis]